MRRSGMMRAGYSLVELLISLVVASIVGGSIVTMMISQTWFTATQNRNILNAEDLRDTLHFMTGEIQLAGSGVNEPYFETAAADELIFIGDLDNNGVPDKVRYLYDAAAHQVTRTLYSTTDNGQTWNEQSTDALLNGVAQFGFTYYALGDTAPATADDISSVKIDLSLNTARAATAFTSGRVADQAMTTRVTIRNRLLH